MKGAQLGSNKSVDLQTRLSHSKGGWSATEWDCTGAKVDGDLNVIARQKLKIGNPKKSRSRRPGQRQPTNRQPYKTQNPKPKTQKLVGKVGRMLTYGKLWGVSGTVHVWT